MPLIIVTGLPSSGKTRLSRKLFEYFQDKLKPQQNHKYHVKLVSDEDNLEWEGRDNVYMSIPKEKELRAWLRSEAQRFVNLDQIVILDAAAYIKGYRYELFCMSKESKTQYCIIENRFEPDICWQWNQARLKSFAENKQEGDEENPQPGYSKQTFDALVMRYESCNENNRWDSPLFCITSSCTDKEHDLFEQIYQTVVEGEPLKPNKCTSLIHTK